MDKAPRYRTSEIATIQIYGRAGDLTARLKNISSTGARFELISGDRLPKPNDFIHVVIHLGALKKSHTLNGQVIWGKDLEFGITFIKKDNLADAILRTL
jgi:hypothetical protein